MKLIWLTDIHLNFLKKPGRVKFYESIISCRGDALLITGDIAEAPSVVELLQEMASHIKLLVYFVLGNHDYYYGEVAKVRNVMHALIEHDEYLNWMPAKGPLLLNEGVLLIGQDGWADGRYGDYVNSNITMSDSLLIADLLQQTKVGKFKLLEKMQELADLDAEQLKHNCLTAIEQYQPSKIIIITHIPPFSKACKYKGFQSPDNWVPFLASKATGDVLLSFAEQYPEIEFLILCGHTHGKAFYQPLDNLSVKVGHAEYYYPEVAEVFEV